MIFTWKTPPSKIGVLPNFYRAKPLEMTPPKAVNQAREATGTAISQILTCLSQGGRQGGERKIALILDEKRESQVMAFGEIAVVPPGGVFPTGRSLSD